MMAYTAPKPGDLCVWHIAQIPGAQFQVRVTSLTEAVLVIRTLQQYDAFQYQQHIKPDYASVSGLEVFEDGEWSEWESDDFRDIKKYMAAQEQIVKPA